MRIDPQKAPPEVSRHLSGWLLLAHVAALRKRYRSWTERHRISTHPSIRGI